MAPPRIGTGSDVLKRTAVSTAPLCRNVRITFLCRIVLQLPGVLADDDKRNCFRSSASGMRFPFSFYTLAEKFHYENCTIHRPRRVSEPIF